MLAPLTHLLIHSLFALFASPAGSIALIRRLEHGFLHFRDHGKHYTYVFSTYIDPFLPLVEWMDGQTESILKETENYILVK